jgi:hypothetical protein
MQAVILDLAIDVTFLLGLRAVLAGVVDMDSYDTTRIWRRNWEV